MRTTLLVLVLVASVSGCGGPADIESNPELSGINNLVRMIGDTDDVEGWKQLFVEGAAPEDNSKYAGPLFIFSEEQNVTISGDTAEIEVLVVTDTGETDEEGFPVEQEETVTWTAQKVGEKWRLKTAPLPP